MLSRFMTVTAVGAAKMLLATLPQRWFSAQRDALAALWFDLSRLEVPEGAATDTSFGAVRLFDDFTRKAIDTTNLWTTNADSGGTAFAINEQHNGAARGTGDGTDNDITNLFSPPMWRCDKGGPMTLEIRATLITSLANGEEYIGWSDDDGTDENPITLTTSDVATTNASNAAGFAYTGGGTADWKAVSVNGDADGTTTRCNTGGVTTPVLGTWQTFKVVLNADGDADFYIDGIFHYREDAAVSTSALLAVAVAQQDGGAARSTDVDYVYVSAGRS